MRITAYSDRLLQVLKKSNGLIPIKEMPKRNLDGKIHRWDVVFPSKRFNANHQIFTTRVDTIFGVHLIGFGPEDELAATWVTEDQPSKAKPISIAKTVRARAHERCQTTSGAFTGSYAINPFQWRGGGGKEKKFQIWVADYVCRLWHGAVMLCLLWERELQFCEAILFRDPQVIEGSMENGSFLEKVDNFIQIQASSLIFTWENARVIKAIEFLRKKVLEG